MKAGDSVFKIRRKSDGRFSRGGSDPKFTVDGKTWSKRHHAVASWREHVKTVRYVNIRRSAQGRQLLDDEYTGKCEIVRYDVTEAEAFEPAVGGDK